MLYDDEQWEEFIREWVTAIKPDYVQIKRFGGSGDRGADVAAFKTDRGLEGSWDCFQGKHYARSLSFSDAAPEMLKVFRAVTGGHWSMPDSYQFVAPRGCGGQLNQLLSSPTKIKERFLRELHDAEKALGSTLDREELKAITELAEQTEFNLFKSVEVIDLLAAHAKTKYHAGRFGTELPVRPVHQAPPPDLREHENRYVVQLMDVYKEEYPDQAIDPDTVLVHQKLSAHFSRQRQAFYRAESLRMYARDSVADGTFELLQDDIHSGVIDIVEDAHPNGRTRLSRVMAQVVALDLQHHTLIQRTNFEDRKGICHQLANDDRVFWVEQP